MVEARFLNRTRLFVGSVDWAFSGYGRLWNYHLHYLNWLNNSGQQDAMLLDYLTNGFGHGSSLDSYPTSVRIVNVVKAIIASRITDIERVLPMLSCDVLRLRLSPEYHLLGNHLLENGFGLIWGGLFLADDRAFRKGKNIVASQLVEQTLGDGGHFERSPMYHSIILWRLLDTANLLRGTQLDDRTRPFERLVVRYAKRMLGWLSVFPFQESRGHFKDAAPGMAPTKRRLQRYGRQLGINPVESALADSGYRIIGQGNLKMLADVGSVAPDYQPAHSHADSLAFELYHNEASILVDTGTSTYEAGARRAYERSTKAHNTVEVGGLDSSEVWSSFRVARRARTTILCDASGVLSAQHDGYQTRLGIVHRRTWQSTDSGFAVNDEVFGKNENCYRCYASFFVAPGYDVNLVGDTAFVGPVVLSWTNSDHISVEQVQIAIGFNQIRKSVAVKVRFSRNLTCRIVRR